ncbi:hypothetical protein D9M72_249950 [compost metagenome]
MAVGGACARLVGFDLGRLAQVGGCVHAADAGLHLDQRRHGRRYRARGHGTAAVGEQFGMQRVAAPGLAMAGAGAGRGQRVVQDAVGHQELAVVARPQQVVGQLMAEHRQQLRRRQPIQQRPLQDDVDLAGHVDQRGVHVLARGLVERRGRADAEPRHRLGQRRVHAGMRVRLDAVGVAQQHRAQCLALIGAGRAGAGPAPDLGLMAAQVVDHRCVIGQRHQRAAIRGVRVHAGRSRVAWRPILQGEHDAGAVHQHGQCPHWHGQPDAVGTSRRRGMPAREAADG